MSVQLIITVGDAAGLEGAFNGIFFKGHREPRIAMVGRSNVGKSSLINALVGQQIARVSVQPGKTRVINFILWPKARKILVDLPGYGFAKRSKTERDQWARMIAAYIESDTGLERAIVLLDARHGPTDLDEEAIQYLRRLGVELSFVFTKSDQLKTQSDRLKRSRAATQALAGLGCETSAQFWVSSRTRDQMHVLIDCLSQSPFQDKD